MSRSHKGLRWHTRRSRQRFSDGETSPAYGGGVTWMFNRASASASSSRTSRRSAPAFSRTYYCCGIFDDSGSSATVFTTNVRLEVPTTSKRIIPFVTAGGGVAAVTPVL
jgi:hypothetical protein